MLTCRRVTELVREPLAQAEESFRSLIMVSEVFNMAVSHTSACFPCVTRLFATTQTGLRYGGKS